MFTGDAVAEHCSKAARLLMTEIIVNEQERPRQKRGVYC